MMRTSIKFFLLLFCFCTSAGLNLQAQDETSTSYAVMSYMQVAPGMHQDYLAMEAAWKKIHQANVEAGKYKRWVLARVAYPNGAQAQHNYVTRIMVEGEQQLANFMSTSIIPENVEALLTTEEMALVERTSAIRTHIKTEVFAVAEYLGGDEPKAEVMVFNYFGYPAGSGYRDHFQVERDFWMPVHQARINASEMEAWVLLRKVLPYGDAQSYGSATVDVYESMEEFLTQRSPVPNLTTHHGADKLDEIFEQTDAAATLLLGEVRISIDRTTLAGR